MDLSRIATSVAILTRFSSITVHLVSAESHMLAVPFACMHSPMGTFYLVGGIGSSHYLILQDLFAVAGLSQCSAQAKPLAEWEAGRNRMNRAA